MQAPTAREWRFCAAFVAGLIVAAAAACADHRVFAAAPAFIAAFAGTTGWADALTAALLLSLYRIHGSRMLLAAATAYLMNALLIIPYALTFPGVIDAQCFIGNEQSALCLWIAWHFTFAIIVGAGVFGTQSPTSPAWRLGNSMGAVAVCVIFAAGATITVTAARDNLPILVRHGTFSPMFPLISLMASLTNLGAIPVLFRARRSIPNLHLWLIVALIASALDTALNTVAPARYSIPWYVGKAQTLVSASVVLFALLGAWSALQTRSDALARRLSLTLTDGRVLAQELKRKREIAAALQQALLPSVLPTLDGIILNAVYRPAVNDLVIGGDWYDAFVLGDGRLAFTIGDVLGHGLAASVVMGHVRLALRMAAAMFTDPSLMLTVADAMLRQEHAEVTVTAFVGVLDRDSGALQWASAGHPPVMVRRPNGTIVELASLAPPLGLYDVTSASAEIELQPGSLLVAYTDGLIEVKRDVIAGLARVRSALAGDDVLALPDPANMLFETIVGEAVRDDVAVMTLCFRLT